MSERPVAIPPEHWKRLGDTCHIEMGQSPPSTYVFEGLDDGLPFLQGNAEFGEPYPKPIYSCAAPAKVGKAGSVLISVRAPVGAVNLADQDYCIGRGLAAILPRKYPATFIAAAVNKRSDELARVSQGTTFEAIGKRELHNLEVFSPELTTATKIAEVLDTLDAAIRGTEAVVAKLRAMKQGLLHDLLTRGIDANGDLRPPQPEAPHLYHQTPLGWLPKEWERARFVSKIDFPQGQVSPLQEPYKNWILIAPDHIESGTGRRLSSHTAAEQNAISGKYTVEPGDIVYSKIRPYLRKVILSEQQALCSADMYPLRPKAGVNPRFLLGLILGEDFSRFAEAVSMRSGFPKINRTELSEYWCYWPDHNEQELIAERLNAFDEKENLERAALEKLRSQKSGLMDDLLTGRVSVTPLL